MTRKEFIGRIAEVTGLEVKNVSEVVTALEEVVVEEVLDGGGEVVLKIGKFKAHDREERESRVPYDGSTVVTPARRTIKFKAGSKSKKDI